MDNEYMPITEEAQPTSESIETAKQESTAETRPCSVCQEPVSVGQRVSVLTSTGEQWRHPWHS